MSFEDVKEGDVVHAYVPEGEVRGYYEPLRVERVTDKQIVTEGELRFWKDSGNGIAEARFRWLTSADLASIYRLKWAIEVASPHLSAEDRHRLAVQYEEIARLNSRQLYSLGSDQTNRPGQRAVPDTARLILCVCFSHNSPHLSRFVFLLLYAVFILRWRSYSKDGERKMFHYFYKKT